jgi:protein MBA1
MRNVLKDAMSGAGGRDMIPDDLGLMPGTFIRPLWKNMPSIFRDPKQRLQMEWLSLKTRVENFIRSEFARFTNSS